ncbi:MAG: glycogen synthase GlgA [Lachnospiraceae bacterium]|nr:glycogen synthase GlgA [Lachnospiraceae bacterium]
MNILYAAAEAVPFAKSGGLGDVAGALPIALKNQGADVRVVIPFYQDISRTLKSQAVRLKEVWVPLSWRQQYCGVYQAEANGIIYYLLDNKYYFGRKGYYGYGDDAERFAFFSKAILEMLQYIDFQPDVINCNDWQTGLVPYFLNKFYRNINDTYKNLQTVYTIHNIQYQGVFAPDIVEYVLGVEWSEYSNGYLQFDNCVNYMKAGIEAANWVTTVSPTYATEIQNPYYGHRLDHMLRMEKAKLSGIINGIDIEKNNPAADPALFAPYNEDDLSGKAVNKKELQEALGLEQREDVPLLVIVSRLADHKGLDLVEAVLGDILSDDVQLAVLGIGEKRYEDMFANAAAAHPGKVAAKLLFDGQLAQQMYAGADILLMPSQSEPCGLAQMIAMRYGTVPLVRETGGLKDTVKPYVAPDGDGTGFTFANYNAHDMLHVIRQAEELFKNKEEWSKVIANGMAKDVSWNVPAKEYMKLYSLLTGK